jgi:hypothetical protein
MLEEESCFLMILFKSKINNFIFYLSPWKQKFLSKFIYDESDIEIALVELTSKITLNDQSINQKNNILKTLTI